MDEIAAARPGIVCDLSADFRVRDRNLHERHYGRLINLLAAGLVCGLIWEFWNYWAGTKWKYNVPIFPELRLFEMPIAGFGGFPPFALECFAMYVLVRRLIWRGGRRPISL